MSKPRYLYVATAIWLVTIGKARASETGHVRVTIAASAAAWQSTDDEDRDRQVMERFRGVLEKNPRRGTALDRVYGYHVERGTLEKLVARYRDRTSEDPKDASAWMILGMIEAQRGRDAAAVAAFREAENHAPENPLAAYYLGQSLVLVGQPDAAAEAFERAINRKPNRLELLEIFQALGRVYQRAHRNEQAIAVWSRLEQLFPDDQRVQEQIAATLAEEEQHAEALKRYESLAAKVKDDEYREVTFRIQAAELKVRLGQSANAVTDFEGLLGRLNPDSWLFREVRRRIEEVFLRNDDLAGLAKYYEGWLEKNSEDIEGMTRLGRTLANLGRAAESQEWYDKAIKLAPSRRELRLSLIEQFVRQQKFADAIAQYEALDKNEPNNPDTIREWGRLISKDTSRPEDERKPAAAAVWRRLVEARPKDPVPHTQVADLFRQAEMADEAIALYQKAIELAPDAAQYREYLGEYYHTLKRPDDALATWREIAAGNKRNAKNLTRLAEVLASFGYRAEAIESLTDANKLEPDEFDRQFKLADLLHQAERFDDALQQLDAVAKLATKEEERGAVLDQQIKNYQALDRLAAQTESLEKRLKQDKNATAEDWRRLARYFEAARLLSEAVAAIRRAVEFDESSIASWAVAARLHESSGNLLAAAEANRKLAAIDRRARTEFLTNVARLESRLGRKDQAIQAGRDLIAAAPGNPEHYQFFAELCFQLGETDEGFDSLRRAARVNPSDPQALLTLAAALAERFRIAEAIELYWQAFDKAADLDAKLGIVSSLTNSYLLLSQLDRLVERLSRMRSEAKEPREMTICLAQAYQAAGDYGTARQELERLLTQNTRDTKLLNQLSSLAETERDLAAAAKYQRQLNEIAPSKDGEARLAQLYVRSGEVAEAEVIWAELASGEQEPARTLAAIDSLLNNSKFETVLTLTDRLLREKPRDWELMYRDARALVGLDKRDEAGLRFQAILDIRLSDDDKSEIVKARMRTSAGRPAGAPATTPSAHQVLLYQAFPLQDRSSAVYQIRSVTGLEPRYYYGGQQTWSPADFGQARMAALGWLLSFAQKENRHEELIARFREGSDKAVADTRPLWDLYYLQLVRQDQKGVYEIARTLSKTSDPGGQWLYLTSLAGRTIVPGQRVVSRGVSTMTDNTPPLPADELQHILACYRDLRTGQPQWLTQPVLTNVTTELKRAKRTEDEEQVYRDGIDAATQADAIPTVMSLAAMRGDVDGLLMLFERLERQQSARTRYGYGYNPVQQSANALAQAMRVRAEAKVHTDLFRLFDRYLTYLIVQKSSSAPGRSSTSNPPGNPYASRSYYQIWTSAQYGRGVNIDYPSPNDYYDHGAILLLRNAFEHFKRDDLLSDLIAHFRGESDKAAESDRVFWRLGLGYLHWWNDDKDSAIAELTLAAAAKKDDLNMQLELAEILERNARPDEALAIVESIEPLDNNTMRRREIAALRVAVVTGNVDRARQAAERLFGLQLDSETQMQLAGQMHQLGMHELAEAVLGRARRRAGSRANTLSMLMTQYQMQNKPDLAIQVAYQILRLNPSQPNYPGQRTEDDMAREQALQVLGRSGKLQEMIARTEAQLKSSPNSMQLHQSMADLYRAAGQRDKVKELFERMAKLRPDDSRLAFQMAGQLVAAGDAAKAVEFYKAAFKKEPSLLGQRYWEVQNTFEQAKKTDELVQLLEDIDLRATGSYSVASELVQRLVQNEKTREQGMRLFRKVWQAFPNERQYVLNNFYDESIWQLPEMFEFARESLIPGAAQTQIQAWAGVDQVLSWSGDGRVTSVFSRVLDTATKQNKLDAITQDLKAAVERLPDWNGGKALVAILQVRQGQIEPAKQSLQELLADAKNPMPAYARLIIGQELENYGPLEEMTLGMYEAGMKQGQDEYGNNLEYRIHPASRLVKMYQRAGRLTDAREMVLKFAKRSTDDPYDARYSAYRKLNDLSSISEQLIQLGYPADAVRLYNEILIDSERLQLANSMYGGDRNYMTEQVMQGLNRALEGLNAETLARTVRELLKPVAGRDASDSALDLVRIVQPRDLDRATFTSMLATSLQSARNNGQLLAEIETDVGKLREDHPRDLSVHVAAALAAFATEKPDDIREAVERLAKLVDETPLEPLPPGARANARQRAEAATQLDLWLVAREAWKLESLRETGDKLADRAMAAALRQLDTGWSLAMLRELGQLALERDDRQTAEKHWSTMLDIVLVNPAMAKKSPAEGPAGATPARVIQPCANEEAADPESEQSPTQAPSPAQTRAAAPDRPNLTPPISLDRFEQAARIAKLAAENKMHALSLRAIGEAMRGGPPIASQGQASQGRLGMVGGGAMPRSMSPLGAGGEDPTVFRQVEARINELDPIWKRSEVPAADVYETLAKIVLPEARPGEVLLYPLQLTQSGVERPRSVAAVLVRWSVAAGTVDDLRARIDARAGQPLAELPSKVLLAMLGLASKNQDLTAESLGWLSDRLQRDTLQNTADLACHAAMPALHATDTSELAMPVVERAAKNMASQQNVSEEPVGSLMLALARLQFDRKNPDEGRRQLQEYLRMIESTLTRYGGDYAPHRRKQVVARVASEYARAGQLADALDMLGQYADGPQQNRYYYGGESIGSVAARIAQLVLALPAAERFELLKAWSMPTETRKSIRLVSSFVPTDAPPTVFQQMSGWLGSSLRAPSPPSDDSPNAGGLKTRPQPPVALGSDVVSFGTLLIDAAREVEKLDELVEELKKAADDKVENAQTVTILAQIARGQSDAMESAVKEFADELPKKSPGQNDPSKRIEFSDYLVARACLNDSKLQPLGERMIKELILHSQRGQDHIFMSHLRTDLSQNIAGRLGGKIDRDGGLALWHPTVHQSANYHQAGTVPGWWVAHDGHISQITGPEWQYLFFDYPLTGTFEFSVEGWTGGWSEAHVGYGGLSYEVMGWSSSGTIWTTARNDSISRPCRFIRNDAFTRFTIQVQPDKVRLLVNGHLFYEDKDPSPTSPWLALFTGRERQTVWRNLKITGQPEIPRDVRLSHADRLEGWCSSFFYESQPPRRSVGQTETSGRKAAALAPDSTAYDWSARDGVIHGRRGEVAAQLDPVQSRLYYHRPLRDGETLGYEFYYEPDTIVVHPALDRLAFLLEPDGVRVHWITDGPDDVSGLKSDNAVDEPSNRRGPERLPLKPGEWNAVEISLASGTASIKLNGAEIYERELEPTNDRLFGLFHYKDRSSVQVRNVMLRGNWPDRLTPDQLAQLAAWASAKADATDSRTRASLIGEKFISQDAENVLHLARGLPAAARYSRLLAWVAPADDHAAFRLYGSSTPTDPAPPVAKANNDTIAGPADARRVHTGGTLEAPAIELVRVAKELGKLDDLAALIEKAPANSEHDERAKLAMMTLIRLAQARDDEALKLMEQLKPLLTKVASDEPDWARWPELLVTSQAIDHSKLLAAARDMVEHIVTKQIQDSTASLSEPWRKQVYHVGGRGHALVQPEPARASFGTPPKLESWTPVTRSTATSRGTGSPPTHWSFHDGELKHYHGHHHDQVYFHVPLRGNFEVSCELFGWREVNLAYGGRLLALGWHRKDFWLSHLGYEARAVTISPPLEGVDYSYRYRLEIKDGTYAAYVNDRKLHEERLPAVPDPWLVLHQPWGHFGGLKGLKVVGSPNVPDALPLSALPDLTGWLADYYEEPVTGDNRAWEKRGEEIFGRQFIDAPGSKQESVLQYHRPMLEDGEIEYEFFYDLGKAATHPALDRLTFLIDPAGVRFHWMTDGKYDRTGLAPDNGTDEPANRRGPAELPLKQRDWNRVKLALVNDTVTLRLNDELVCERELESTNQRTFGLFHFADETEVRVRNVIYRGNWPRTLPEIQELAAKQ